MSGRAQRACELLGWLTFVASALCYVVSALRAGDALGLAGGVLFFAACLMFLLPLMRRAEGRAGGR